MSSKSDSMEITEKKLSKTEIEEILSPIFKDYFRHYTAKLMSFHEFAIIENLMMKIQWKLTEKFEEEE